jgi:hypothetical protein
MTNDNENTFIKLIEIVRDSFIDDNEIIELRERKITLNKALNDDDQNVNIMAQIVAVEMMLTLATMKKAQREHYIKNN